MAVHRVRLIHWKAEEAREKVRKLREAGYRVAFELPDNETFKKIKKSPPDVVVIDLSRTPSHGRDAALFLRQTKATRHVPLVFVDGDPDKVERIRKLLPDAEYTPWRRIRSSLKRAIAHPPKDPVVPKSTMDGYAGTPLPEKLGIKADSVVALIGAPEDFEKTLGKLPRGVKVRRAARGKPDLAIWFTKSRKDLERRIRLMGGLFGKGGLWIAWPKKTSKTRSDLTQESVRKIGLASGLVDYKVCSIDDKWSGLKFARRKPS
jgi:hypothetical protein